jgi:hypothetical protein
LIFGTARLPGVRFSSKRAPAFGSAANPCHSTNKQADIYLHKKALDDLPDLVCIEPILNWFNQSWTKRKAIRTMRWRS